MIDFLLGVPGKLKTISDYLTTNWTTARAAKVDNLDAAISTRAVASTALTNATWTDARAAKLTSVAQSTEPLLASPIAANFGTNSASTTSAAYVTALSITGAGVLNYIKHWVNSANAGSPSCKITIDGVVVRDAGVSLAYPDYGIAVGECAAAGGQVFAYAQLPFHTSLLIEHKASGTAPYVITTWNLYRTS